VRMRLRKEIATTVASFTMVIAVASAPLAAGEDFSFTASVERVAVDVAQEFSLTVSVSGTGIGDVGEPELPTMNDFDVLGRSTSQSSQFSIINGKVSSRKTIDYIYALRPRRTGELTIPSAKVKYKGKEYRTEPIAMRVAEGSTPSQQTPDVSPETLPEGDIFLDGRVDKTLVYVGEQVNIDYSLFVAVGLSNVRLGNIPSYAGFWSEEIFSAKRLDFKTRVLNGKRYDVAPIKSVALFPTMSGEFEIDPMSIVCDVAVRSRDPIRDFWGASRTITVKSSPITVKVKALPGGGRPAGFSGAVGSFEFSVDASPESVSVGEPLEVLIRASGQGNIRTLEVPGLPEMKEFKIYEPEVSIDVSRSKGRISGSKTYKYMLVPNSQGEYIIQALTFSFFDPRDEKYHVVSTDEITVHVKPGAVEEMSGGPARGPVQVLGRDILYIKPNMKRMSRGGAHLYQSGPFLVLQFVPAAVLLFTFFFERHRRRIDADASYVRSRRARAVARARLKNARARLDREEPSAVASEVARAVLLYVGDKMNLNAAGLTMERILDELRSGGVTEPVIANLEMCVERCDLLRFARSGTDRTGAEEMIELAERAIDALEERGAR